MKVSAITILLVLISLTCFAQKVNRKKLCKKWDIEKYSFNNTDYSPEPFEQNDYLCLNEDMTFELVYEGDVSNGTWEFFKHGCYVVLHCNNGEGLKLYVAITDDNLLIVNFDKKELELTEFYYRDSTINKAEL